MKPMAAALLPLLLTLAAPALAQTQTSAPRRIAGQPVQEIVAGNGHSCARLPSGRVWCWGLNDHGQLGDGTTENRTTPVRVRNLTGVVQITAGEHHTCALRDTGRIFCWGRNHVGQLGDGTTTSSPDPVRVVRLQRVQQVAAGYNHSCALMSTGRVFCWGVNVRGQLGDGSLTDSLVPVRVNGSAATRVVQIGAGGAHSCALRDTGRVSCWGQGSFGQLGNGSWAPQQPTPVLVRGVSSVTQLATGHYHNCALRDTGRAFCWGWNSAGALGDGTRTHRNTAVRVRNLQGAVHLAAGGNAGHSCAIRDTGRVFCWGYNLHGQVGNGSPDDFLLTPVRVPVLTDAVEVSVGLFHTCGRNAAGVAFCWGFNNDGALGDGTTTERRTPVRVRN